MPRYRWAAWGDVNAFFGLMLDNITVMIILVSSISQPVPSRDFFSSEFVLTRMIPGTVLGVLIGDLVYTWMAIRLARKTGRTNVTAMPLGLDTPSTFAVAFLVLLPALKEGQDKLHLDHASAMAYAWHVGAVVLVLVGVFKVLCAPLGNQVRKWVPRAGLLGSLAAIALVLISFLPLLNEIAAVPLVGFLSLAVILVTLVAHRPLPGKIPGALAAVLLGTFLYHLFAWLGRSQGWNLIPPHPLPAIGAWEPPTWPLLDWELVWQPALARLPIILPFALATVVGGIDCTESAAAAGDEYDTRTILLTEGAASLVAGLAGGVIQNTPYIGQPAYKAMGGRAAYTLATALFIGAAGCFGWFAHLFSWLPQAAMFPILVFVGLEITAQSFRATPNRHYAALALAILPALAYLAVVLADGALGGRPPTPHAEAGMQTLRCLANGFIVTSLLWGAALAALLDGRFARSAAYWLTAGVFSLVGIIHSPLREAPLAWPWEVLPRLGELGPSAVFQTPYHWAGAYGLVAAFILGLGFLQPKAGPGEKDLAGATPDNE